MFKEYVKFTKDRPLTGAVIGISLYYASQKIYMALTKDKGRFWGDTFEGIGASTSTTSSTSSSHSMMDRKTSGDLMTHPTALYGIGSGLGHCNCAVPTCPSCATKGLAGGMSTTTSTSSAHAHKRNSNYGEDTYKSPLTLMGVPSHIKRRVGNAEETESYQTNNPVVAEVETVESALGWL